MIELRIDEPTPSLNRLLRGHWAKQHRTRNRWLWLVRQARLAAQLWPQPLPRARVTIERYGPRILDVDNFVAGTKFLTDSLVKERFLAGDTPRHIVPDYRQYVGKPPRVLVRIEPLVPGD